MTRGPDCGHIVPFCAFFVPTSHRPCHPSQFTHWRASILENVQTQNHVHWAHYPNNNSHISPLHIDSFTPFSSVTVDHYDIMILQSSSQFNNQLFSLAAYATSLWQSTDSELKPMQRQHINTRIDICKVKDVMNLISKLFCRNRTNYTEGGLKYQCHMEPCIST